MKSTHRVEVVPVQLEKHCNADTLSIVRVFGYTVVVRTKDWEGIEKGAYIVPDTMVPNRPPFEFLFEKTSTTYNIDSDGYAIKSSEGKYARVTAIKLRKVQSFGLLIPAPEGAEIGEDVSEQLGVHRYVPPIAGLSLGQEERPPTIYVPTYDVEALQRYPDLFKKGEPVCITEKVHGGSARYVYHEGRMWAGSRTRWRKESVDCIYWEALKKHPEVEEYCRNNPDVVVFGEVFGPVQSLKYNRSEPDLVVFDIYRNGQYMSVQDFRFDKESRHLPFVPEVAPIPTPFDMETIATLSEGDSIIEGVENQMMEGVVIRPMKERIEDEIGRLQLKYVSSRYLGSGD